MHIVKDLMLLVVSLLALASFFVPQGNEDLCETWAYQETVLKSKYKYGQELKDLQMYQRINRCK